MGLTHAKVSSGTVNPAVEVDLHDWNADHVGTLGVANGGTGADLSATGGASQFVKQTSAGGALTVGTISASDLPANAGLPTASSAGDTIYWDGANWVVQHARTTITASVTAANNDYSPTGYTTATGWLRLTSTGTWNITGIVAQTPGDILVITNVGASNKITLVTDSASSAAANRMTLGNNVVLGPAQTLCLVYDSSSVWRPFSAASGFGGPLYINATRALDFDGHYTILSSDAGNHVIAGDSFDPTTYYRQTTHVLQSLAAATYAQIDATGLSVVGLTDLSNAASGQIKFPSSQNASSNANTLDDYAEGTFTPVVTFGGGSTGITYTNQVGKHTKIGNVVHYSINIALSSKGSSTGTLSITGLPFTVVSGTDSIGAVQCNNMSAGTTTTLQAQANNGATTLSVSHYAAGANTNLADTDFTNTSVVKVTGIYFV